MLEGLISSFLFFVPASKFFSAIGYVLFSVIGPVNVFTTGSSPFSLDLARLTSQKLIRSTSLKFLPTFQLLLQSLFKLILYVSQ